MIPAMPAPPVTLSAEALDKYQSEVAKAIARLQIYEATRLALREQLLRTPRSAAAAPHRAELEKALSALHVEASTVKSEEKSRLHALGKELRPSMAVTISVRVQLYERIGATLAPLEVLYQSEPRSFNRYADAVAWAVETAGVPELGSKLWGAQRHVRNEGSVTQEWSFPADAPDRAKGVKVTFERAYAL